MNYKKALEDIVQRRREQLTLATELYSAAIRSNVRLYEIELALRKARLIEVHGEKTASNSSVDQLEKEKNQILAELGIANLHQSLLPNCKICQDSGVVDGKICLCVKRQAILQEEHIGLPIRSFADSNSAIEGSKELSGIYQHLRAFVQKFPDTNTKNIILMGNSGTGKTFLASCVVGEILAKGYSVVFLTAFEVQQKMLAFHTSFDAGKADNLLPLLDCDLLVIDDLGTESILKNVTKEYFYIVINERTLKNRHTLITTNCSMDEISSRYGEKILSRIFDKNISLSRAINGKDLRKI